MTKKIFFFLTLSLFFNLFLANEVRAQEGGTFSCTYEPGYGCVADTASASCIGGYQVDESVCAAIDDQDFDTCQGTVNEACIPVPGSPSSLCYACIFPPTCEPVDSNTYGYCPYPNTPEGVSNCNTACSGPGETNFSCGPEGYCIPDPYGEYVDPAACDFACTLPNNAPNSPDLCAGGQGLVTAIGCMRVILEGENAEFTEIATMFLRFGIGVGGGISLLLIFYSGFLIMTSAGNPQRLTSGKELMTAAVSGILMLLLSGFILRIIGVNILGLDRFGL